MKVFFFVNSFVFMEKKIYNELLELLNFWNELLVKYVDGGNGEDSIKAHNQSKGREKFYEKFITSVLNWHKVSCTD